MEEEREKEKEELKTLELMCQKENNKLNKNEYNEEIKRKQKKK